MKKTLLQLAFVWLVLLSCQNENLEPVNLLDEQSMAFQFYYSGHCYLKVMKNNELSIIIPITSKGQKLITKKIFALQFPDNVIPHRDLNNETLDNCEVGYTKTALFLRVNEELFYFNVENPEETKNYLKLPVNLKNKITHNINVIGLALYTNELQLNLRGNYSSTADLVYKANKSSRDPIVFDPNDPDGGGSGYDCSNVDCVSGGEGSISCSYGDASVTCSTGNYACCFSDLFYERAVCCAK